MRQFSGHHISRLGNKNHPSFRGLVRHRFSAFWLRSSVVSVLIGRVSESSVLFSPHVPVSVPFLVVYLDQFLSKRSLLGLRDF